MVVLVSFFAFFVGALAEEAALRVPVVGPWARRRITRRAPQRLTALFQGLGGAFIKFGQMFSMRVDLLPLEYCQALSQLYDRVPPFPVPEARAIIARELKAPLEELFDDFEEVPLGAATFGQVHRVVLGARHPDRGRRAVIKIQRPEAEARLKQDARLLQVMAWGVDASSVLGRIKILPVARDFVRWTRREVNFTLEGKNADRLWEVTQWNDAQRIPHVYWEYTTPRVLTLEEIEGTPLSTLIARFEADDPGLDDDLAAMECDRLGLARAVYQNFFLQAFIGRVFHADPHPGNLLVLPGNVIGYVDFGLLGRMNPEDFEEQLAILDAVARADMERLFVAVLDILDAPRGLLVTDYFDHFHEVADAWLDACDNPGATLGEKSLSNFIHALMELARAIGLPLTMSATLYFKALMAVDASILRLAPELDYNAETTRAQRMVKVRQIEAFMTPNAALDRSLDLSLLLLTLPDFLATELTTYKQRTRRMYRKLNQLPLVIARLLRLLGAALGLTGAALLVVELELVEQHHLLGALPPAVSGSAYLEVALRLAPWWHAFLVGALALRWGSRAVANQAMVKVQGESPSAP